MKKPWSLWDGFSRDQVACILAEALQEVNANSTLIRYREPLGHASHTKETDLRKALKSAALINPKRLVVITDQLNHERVLLLDAQG